MRDGSFNFLLTMRPHKKELRIIVGWKVDKRCKEAREQSMQTLEVVEEMKNAFHPTKLKNKVGPFPIVECFLVLHKHNSLPLTPLLIGYHLHQSISLNLRAQCTIPWRRITDICSGEYNLLNTLNCEVEHRIYHC